MNPESARAFNTVLLVVLILVLVGMLLAQRTASSSQARADRFSVRIRLPYGTDATRWAVTLRLRAVVVTNSAVMTLCTAAALPLLMTPLATSQTFAFLVVFPTLIAGTISSAVVAVRAQLFRPLPDAPRVARARAVTLADYLGPIRRALPRVLAVVASAATMLLAWTWVNTPDRVDGGTAIAAVVAAVIGVALFASLPRLERRVLDQPQPASDPLELAWDDAFRTTSLAALQLAASLAAWTALALSFAAMMLPADAALRSVLVQVPTWGVIALSFVYPSSGRPLRAGLYPAWLRQPALTGGAA